MSCKIVKPFDWQFVRSAPLVVVIAGAVTPGCVVRLFAHQGYFTLGPYGAPVLAQAELHLLSDDLARAEFAIIESWAACVISVIDAAGLEVTACGVNIGHSEVTTWLPGPAQDDADDATADPFRYPLPLVGSAVSHTPGDVHRDPPILPGVDALCAAPLVAPPCSGSSARLGVVGAAWLSEARAYNGMDSLSLQHSLGKDDPAFGEMLGQAHWMSSAPYLVRIADAAVNMPSGLVLFEAGLWSDSTLTAFFNDTELRQHPRLFRAHDRVGYLGGSGTEAALLAANGLDRFPGIPMLLSNIGYGNHAHWLLNSMLAAWYCREQIAAGRICVVVPKYSDYIVASLAAVGVPRRAIVVAAPGFHRFTDVLFPSTLSTHVNRAPPPEVVGMVDAVRARSTALARAAGARLVYLTRQGSGAQRKIGNENELIAALKLRGFVVVAPHELTFDEEVSCVAEADVIVGQLGAAMINIAFAPRTAWIVELASQNYAACDYWVLATTLGQRFVRVLARAPLDEALTLTDFSFEIPLEATLASIDRVCETARGERSQRGDQ